MQHHEEHQQRRVNPADGSEGPASASKKEPKTGQPYQEVARVHQQRLLEEKRDRRELDVLAGGTDALQILDGWESVLPLPDKVGQKDRQRHRGAEPDPWPRELAAERCRNDRDRHGGAEKEGRMFVLEPETGEDAEHYPETWIAAANDTDQDQDAAHPKERLERIHRQDAIDRQVDRGDDDPETGESLGKRAAAELSGDQDRQRHHGSSRQHRQHPQRRQRTAEQQRDLGVHRDQRRAVHIPPVQVARAVEEIELVAEVAVPEKTGNVEEHLGRHQAEKDSVGESRKRWQQVRFVDRGVVLHRFLLE